MKNIKEQINKRPRLKKCLKLLAVVGICLSVLFNALILGVAIADNVRNGAKIKGVTNQATTPVKNLYPIELNGVRANIYTFSDIANSTGYHAIINYLRDIDYYAPTYNYAGTTQYMNLIEYGGQDNIDNFVNLMNYNVSNGVPSTFFQARRLRFFSSTFTTGGQAERRFLYVGFGNDGNNEEYGLEYSEFIDIGISTYRGMSGNLITCRPVYMSDWTSEAGKTYDVPLFSIYSPKGADSGSTSVLDAMFDTAVRNSESWSLGYNEGYRDGRESLPPEDTNSPFALISRAFDSVASILNIELLPNLTIGVILFTPVIVAVIIVVVKMIKG